MTEEQNKLADRLEAMLHQVGHPDYSLRELYEGLKLIVWELRQDREPATEAVLGDEILTELDEAGAIGLDMSPGDPLARKAAGAIRLLIKRIAIVARERDAALKGKGASQGAERTCSRCKGSGDVKAMTQGHGPDDYEVDIACPDCSGTGVVAPEPSGEFVRVRKDVVEFLRGAAPLDGLWFGDAEAPSKGRFWWRKYLREAAASPDEQKG